MIYREQGSVLLVSLVLLLIMTVAGLTSIRLSGLEEKMTGNFYDQQKAFHAAEVALLEAENHIDKNLFSLNVFNADCTEGYCFSGNDRSDAGNCSLGSSTPWSNDSTWQNSALHRTTTFDIDGITSQAKYIIEFRCYIPKNNDGPMPDPANQGEWAMFFRVTALATGGSDSTRVMLQSSYKLL